MKTELTIDNRDLDNVVNYLEARVSALACRVQELVAINNRLTRELATLRGQPATSAAGDEFGLGG